MVTYSSINTDGILFITHITIWGSPQAGICFLDYQFFDLCAKGIELVSHFYFEFVRLNAKNRHQGSDGKTWDYESEEFGNRNPN